jgi:hypothetical protein
MALLFRKVLILAKVEATYGVNAAPGAADAMLISNVSIDPIIGDSVDRDLITPWLGGSPKLLAGRRGKLSFSVEVAGNPSLGTAPKWGVLLRGCGMAETVTANTSVQYNPVSSAFESLTFHFNIDGNRHILVGARGNFKLTSDINQIPKWEFEFTGLFVTPTATAFVTPDFTNWVPPSIFAPTRGAFLCDGVESALRKFSFDAGLNVVYDATSKSEEILITARDAKGNLTINAPAISAQNFFQMAATSTETGVTLRLPQPGNRQLELMSNQALIAGPKYGEENGVAVLSMDYTCSRSIDDPDMDFSITHSAAS